MVILLSYSRSLYCNRGGLAELCIVIVSLGPRTRSVFLGSVHLVLRDREMGPVIANGTPEAEV